MWALKTTEEGVLRKMSAHVAHDLFTSDNCSLEGKLITAIWWNPVPRKRTIHRCPTSFWDVNYLNECQQ